MFLNRKISTLSYYGAYNKDGFGVYSDYAYMVRHKNSTRWVSASGFNSFNNALDYAVNGYLGFCDNYLNYGIVKEMLKDVELNRYYVF